QGVGGRHQARDALRAAGAGEEADLDLGQPEPRLLAIGSNAVMAGERQFEAAAHAGAAHRRCERLARGLQAPIDERQLPRAGMSQLTSPLRTASTSKRKSLKLMTWLRWSRRAP